MFHPTWNLEGVLQYFLFKFTINGTCLLHPRFATCFPSRRFQAQFKLIYGRLLIGLLYLNIFHFALSQGPYTILPLIDRYDS